MTGMDGDGAVVEKREDQNTSGPGQTHTPSHTHDTELIKRLSAVSRTAQTGGGGGGGLRIKLVPEKRERGGEHLVPAGSSEGLTCSG